MPKPPTRTVKVQHPKFVPPPDVELWEEGNKWHCLAHTHNWASDTFEAIASSKEGVIKKMIRYITKDGEDLWLLKNRLLMPHNPKKK